MELGHFPSRSELSVHMRECEIGETMTLAQFLNVVKLSTLAPLSNAQVSGHGTVDGTFDRTFDGTSEGRFDGVFDGVFDGTVDGAFDERFIR